MANKSRIRKLKEEKKMCKVLPGRELKETRSGTSENSFK
jgi:hypothetical protein